MGILKFNNTVAGWTEINALPNPKHPIILGGLVTVLTEADVPSDAAAADPSSIVLTTRQLMQGADAIARARLQAIEGYILGIVGLDAKEPTGTYAQIKYWKWHNATIRRTDQEVNAMRAALGWTPSLMDSIFVAGSGMDP